MPATLGLLPRDLALGQLALAPALLIDFFTVDVSSDALLGRLAAVAPNPPASVSVLRELPKTDIAFERRAVIAKRRVLRRGGGSKTRGS